MSTRFKAVVSTFVICLLQPYAAFAAPTATRTITVDTTWRAIGPVGDLTGPGINILGLEWEAANAGWNSQVEFDDTDTAGWTSSISAIHPHQPFVRYWVDGTDVIGSTPAYFRKVFNIQGLPLDGALDFGVDDDAKVYVNGVLVFDDSDGLASDITDVDVTSYLRRGLNLIAIKAHDHQGGQGIWGQLDILYQVPEPSTLFLVITGLSCGLRKRARDRSPV